jgi:mono/diheme cytochrome c family protein
MSGASWAIVNRSCWIVVAIVALWQSPSALGAEADGKGYFETHCYSCHDADNRKGGLDLTALKFDFASAENFARLVKVHDRMQSGEMPPKSKKRPPAAETTAVAKWLNQSLVAAEKKRQGAEGRTAVRRLTRAEYENTIRDLFDLPGIALQNSLPADGAAHGFDKNNEALDISHVNLAKYVEAADQALDHAIATRPTAPKSEKQRINLATQYIRPVDADAGRRGAAQGQETGSRLPGRGRTAAPGHGRARPNRPVLD